ncbi:MAG: hypothetical protein KKB22_07535 [Candidatus Omnitrophica bacterium]|nr:hypothetical protein [Candidatus Omnitrophota bacterium]
MQRWVGPLSFKGRRRLTHIINILVMGLLLASSLLFLKFILSIVVNFLFLIDNLPATILGVAVFLKFFLIVFIGAYFVLRGMFKTYQH